MASRSHGTYVYKGRQHVVRVGPQGGKYIVSGGRKVYISPSSKSYHRSGWRCDWNPKERRHKCYKRRHRRR